MPDSVEIQGDQNNTTVFGISGPWLVALVAVILSGVVAAIWVSNLSGQEQITPTEIISSGSDPRRDATDRYVELAVQNSAVEKQVNRSLTLTDDGSYGFYFDRPKTNEDVSVYEVELQDLRSNSGTVVTVEVVPTDIDDIFFPYLPDGDQIQALLISVDGVEDEHSQNGLIIFSLTDDQLAGSDPSEIKLWRYELDKWNELSTWHLSSAAGKHDFQAFTPGFSLFLITSDKNSSEPTVVSPSETITESPTPTVSPTPIQTQTSAEPIVQEITTRAPEPTLPPIPTATATLVPEPTATATPMPIEIDVQIGSVAEIKSEEFFLLEDLKIKNASDLVRDGPLKARLMWGDSYEWIDAPVDSRTGRIFAAHVYKSGGIYTATLEISNDRSVTLRNIEINVAGTVVATPLPVLTPTATSTPVPTVAPLRIRLVEGSVPTAKRGEYYQLEDFRVENISQFGGNISASVKWGDGGDYVGVPIIQGSGLILAGHTYTSGGIFYGDLRVRSDNGDVVVFSFKVSVDGAVVATPMPSPTPTPSPTATPIPIVPVSFSGKIFYENKLNENGSSDGNNHMWLMDGTNTDHTYLTDCGADECNLDISADGTKITFNQGRRVWIMNADGSDKHLLFENPPADLRWGVSYRPAWSPDGTKIAFLGQVGDSNRQTIFIANADGSNLHRLTSLTSGSEHAPDWSPDGTQIVFAGWGLPGYGLFKINTDGTGLVQITNGDFDSAPSWSPDSSKIVFYRDNRDIWTVTPAGSLTQITNGYAYSQPSWSPSSDKIIFNTMNLHSVFGPYGSFKTGYMNSNGSGITQLTFGINASNYNPVWGP